jgi:hypothetical protein
VVVASLCCLGISATGCGRILRSVVNKATHGKLNQDAKAIDALTSKIKAGQTATYVVTYKTTGSAPATIRVAASPPKDFAFTDTASTGQGTTDLIENASGAYSCSQASGRGAKWSCAKFDQGSASDFAAAEVLYTPKYWVDFLTPLRYAGLAGISITSSTMTVNGFDLQCIVVTGNTGSTTTSTGGSASSSTVCVTQQGIIAYAKTSTDSTAFEITGYSTSPPASLFQVPAGATVSTMPPGTSSTP